MKTERDEDHEQDGYGVSMEPTPAYDAEINEQRRTDGN